MPSPANMLNSQMYYIDDGQVFVNLPDGEFFHTIICIASGQLGVLGDTYDAIAGSYPYNGNRATHYIEAGDYGYAQRLSGKLIENDLLLKHSVTGTFTASKSGGTVAADTVTVTRAGVDVTASVTPPSFDGIITNGSGVMTLIYPTSTVGADLQVGDVLTFEVIVSEASIGDATLTLELDDIDLNPGIYKDSPSSYASSTANLVVGQTIKGRFTRIVPDSGTKLIAYK
jgi:hypothetical protein